METREISRNLEKQIGTVYLRYRATNPIVPSIMATCKEMNMSLMQVRKALGFDDSRYNIKFLNEKG